MSKFGVPHGPSWRGIPTGNNTPVRGTKGGATFTWNDALFDDEGGPAWGITNYVERFHRELAHYAAAVQSGDEGLSTLGDARDALAKLRTKTASTFSSVGGAELTRQGNDPAAVVAAPTAGVGFRHHGKHNTEELLRQLLRDQLPGAR